MIDEDLEEEISSKSSKKDKLDKRLMFGDPYLTGPLIKAPDGIEKNKNLAVIINGYKINIFVNKTNIRSYADTIEKITNNLNHFYLYNKEYRFENVLVDAAYLIDAKVKEFLLETDTKQQDTDMDVIANLASDTLIDSFLTDEMLQRTKAYIDDHTYYDENSYKEAINNYQKSLSIDGVKICLMIGTLIKPIWLILKRNINSYKIKRKTINTKVLASKITIKVFEACIQRASFIYSSSQPDWDGTVYDFHGKVLTYFMDRCDKAIADNDDHIMTKHAILGSGEAVTMASAYETFAYALKKTSLSYAYKPGIVEGDVEEYIRQKYHQELLSGEQFIYVKDPKKFGFNVLEFISFTTVTVDQHVKFKTYGKKEDVVVTIAKGTTKDSEQEGLSRRDKILRKDDIINKEQKRINDQITQALMRDLEDPGKRYEIIEANKIARNVLNTTVIPIYLDVMDITMGNPLAYVNIFEFYKLVAAVSQWDIISKYHTLSTALLCNKSTEAVSVNVSLIQQYCDEYFSDDMNKDIIFNTAMSICSSKWTYIYNVKHDIEIDIHELFAFFKDVQALRKEEDDEYGAI